MFARVAARSSRVSTRFARSFSGQAAAGSGASAQVKVGTAVVATAAIAIGAYAWTSQTQDTQCEPAPVAAPAPAAAPAAAAAKPVFTEEPAVKNSAFVFIKPHAVTDATKELVAEGLAAQGIKVVKQGTITAEEIDKGMLIDQHYYAIASKATLLKPSELNVPAAKFEDKFGIGWQAALNKGVVYNAKDACEHLGVDADTLDKAWGVCGKSKKLVKFGGGFYCGLIDSIPGKEPIYVFNGFFMTMRSQFVKPGVSIYYYTVEWDAAKLSWEDFRGKVLGPTNPASAPKDSLRGRIMQNWQSLGLGHEPNTGDNGVHASASPFEALAERVNWLGEDVTKDHFGKAMLAAGIPTSTITEWSVDPQVTYEPLGVPIKKSLFDSLEDTDADDCLARCMMIAGKPKEETPYLKLAGALAVGGILGAALPRN